MNDLQKEILQIFKVVKKICDDNNLRYYAIGGTCIGAIRHKGFIPWDDDLDIAMPRSDYEKFKVISKTVLPAPYQIIDEKFSYHYTPVFMKVHNVETTLIQSDSLSYADCYSGVFVDIMPLDGLPNNRIMKNIHFFLLTTLMKLNSMRRGKAGIGGKKKILSYFVRLFPLNFFLDIYLFFVKQFSYDSVKNSQSSFAWSHRAKTLILEKEDFSFHTIFKFEDTEISCPKGYDHYLRMHFGDYMKIPEVDKQVAHDNAIIDLTKSYKYYQKEKNEIE
ncbi:LicD family protein [Enterococcus sp. MJM12]|uniref:LicD family protein n=1 Tax=Candidatus Enterococcus myersii TaxID=2815322 RepID=A0ABS3H570_9ENTE|nr:LicD family protein [Enterococcus sp. MJM12]MBO0448187.1 LicD family protein [Enterococcus sp. MJM12]